MNFDKLHAANDNEEMSRHELSLEIIAMLYKLGIDSARVGQVMKRLFHYMYRVDDPNANREGDIYESLDELMHDFLYLFNMYKEQDGIVSEEFKQDVKQTVSAIIAISLPEKDNVIEIDFENKK